MYSRQKSYMALLCNLLACFLVLAVGGCDSEPSTEWNTSDLARTVEELKANSINASAGQYFMSGLENDALYLDIRLENKSKTEDRPRRHLSPGMPDQEVAAIAAEWDAINNADRLALETAVQKDFEILARVLRDKEIPLLKFSGPGLFHIEPHLSSLQCKFLGLWLDYGIDDSLRDIPALKRLYVNNDNTIDGSKVLPQVEDIVITGVQFPANFNLEAVMRAFPNMRSLTLPGGSWLMDYGAVTFPASLKNFNLTNSGSPVLCAYNRNGAKNLPGITHINGIAANDFDPLKTLTPEELASYKNIPGHIWAEKRFAAFIAQPQKKLGSVPLRGKIMLHAEGDFVSQQVREGVDARLRDALTENPEECDVLVVIASRMVEDKIETPLSVTKMVSGNAPVLSTSTGLYLLSRNGEYEYQSIYLDSQLAAVSEDQKERNARYKASGPWGEMELLFRKANSE